MTIGTVAMISAYIVITIGLTEQAARRLDNDRMGLFGVILMFVTWPGIALFTLGQRIADWILEVRP